MIAPTPDGRFTVVTDLGLDAALLYEFENEAFRLAGQGVVKAETGAGPRHFAFSPDGQTAYVINELNSTLDVFAYDGAMFARRQTVSSLPAGFAGTNSCAQVLVAPDGRFVYGSNRGHDSIAIWTVDAEGIVGDVRVVASGGACPRNFALSPDGRWLIAANQDSNNLVVFARDAETGGLRRTDQTIEVDSPVCVIFCD